MISTKSYLSQVLPKEIRQDWLLGVFSQNFCNTRPAQLCFVLMTPQWLLTSRGIAWVVSVDVQEEAVSGWCPRPQAVPVSGPSLELAGSPALRKCRRLGAQMRERCIGNIA